MSYGACRRHSCGLELTNGTKVLDGIVPEQEYPPGMIAGVGPRHAQPFVTDQGIRALLLVVIAISCASCRTDAQLDPIQTASDRDTAVISAQEDCLYREVGRLLEPKGSPPVSLQNIAVAAAHFCSQDSITRRVSASVRDTQKLPREDQAKTEQRAFAIGLELREKETSRGMASN